MHETPPNVASAGAAPAAPSPGASVSGESPQPRSRARPSLRILAADDVRTNREYLRHLTAHCGHTAEIVENGAEVLAALGRSSFDLVLLDVQMPVMDGLTAAREIVRLQPDPGRRPKIVALTANALAEDRKTCLAAGMDDCLAKPVSPKVFAACIDRLFTQPPPPPPAPPPAMPAPPAALDQLLLVDMVYLETAIPGLARTQLGAMHRRMHRAVAGDFESIWPRVVEAVSSRDQGELAGALHALKGCFSTLGWIRIASYCTAAMHRARAQQFAEWATFPDELQQLYSASTAEMTRYLATVESGAPASTTPNEGAGTAPATYI